MIVFEFVLWIRGNNCFIDKQLTNGVCVLPIELEDRSDHEAEVDLKRE